ncbi:MAG: glycosyltransferase family 2 protein [Candidatus Omnitrophica bacterium]|nr:glycosyltransferase family 2 protein [Candidatus Omnitrophota bacterium]
MDLELSVVVLCYGAGRRVYNFVDRIIELLLTNSIGSWEIILVGNYFGNSDDDTPNIVNDIALKCKHNIVVVTLAKKGMMGWDAKSGFSRAGGKYICLIDGDEQMPADDIIRVYRKISNENLDFVKTYRKCRYDSFARRTISRIYNVFFKLLFPGIKLRDINSKPKIFTREAYNKLNLISNDWFLDCEMVIQAHKQKFKIGEISTKFYKCPYRKSFVNSNTIFEFIKNLLYFRMRGFFR